MFREANPYVNQYRLPRQCDFRPETHSYERNDCTVRALANACKLPYTYAHEVLKLNGRKNREGFCLQSLLRNKSFSIYGYTFKELEFVSSMWVKKGSKITIRKFLELDLKGNFIAIGSQHAFAIVNGQIIDRNYLTPNQQLWEVFEVIKPVDMIGKIN